MANYDDRIALSHDWWIDTATRHADWWPVDNVYQITEKLFDAYQYHIRRYIDTKEQAPEIAGYHKRRAFVAYDVRYRILTTNPKWWAYFND